MKLAGNTIPLFLLLAIIMVCAVVVSLPLLGKNNPSVRRAPEAKKLGSICMGAATYLSKYGEFPSADAWHEGLLANDFVQAEDLVSTRGLLGPPATVTRSHFIYFQLPPERDFDQTAVMVYENPEHYDDGYTFAVFADCHVEWIDLDTLNEYLQAQKDLPRSDR